MCLGREPGHRARRARPPLRLDGRVDGHGRDRASPRPRRRRRHPHRRVRGALHAAEHLPTAADRPIGAGRSPRRVGEPRRRRRPGEHRQRDPGQPLRGWLAGVYLDAGTTHDGTAVELRAAPPSATTRGSAAGRQRLGNRAGSGADHARPHPDRRRVTDHHRSRSRRQGRVSDSRRSLERRSSRAWRTSGTRSSAMPRPSPLPSARVARAVAAALRRRRRARDPRCARDGRLVAALPLIVRAASSLRIARFVGGGQSALADLLLAPGRPFSTAGAIADRISSSADLVDLYGLPTESRLAQVGGSSLEVLPRVETPCSTSLTTRPSTDRRQARRSGTCWRRRRQLAELGRLEVVVARSPDELGDALEDAFRLHQLR